MVRLADFNLHMGREPGGHSQPRTENFEDQRVTALDEFDAAAKTDPERFEALHFLIVNRDLADDGADMRRELIQPDESAGGLA